MFMKYVKDAQIGCLAQRYFAVLKTKQHQRRFYTQTFEHMKYTKASNEFLKTYHELCNIKLIIPSISNETNQYYLQIYY